MIALLLLCFSLFSWKRLDGNISLHCILKFITGYENEPVLGFQMKPTICFDTNMPSCLPMGNTCISRLTSPIGENVSMTKEEVFSFFDYANDYFGRLQLKLLISD